MTGARTGSRGGAARAVAVVVAVALALAACALLSGCGHSNAMAAKTSKMEDPATLADGLENIDLSVAGILFGSEYDSLDDEDKKQVVVTCDISDRCDEIRYKALPVTTAKGKITSADRAFMKWVASSPAARKIVKRNGFTTVGDADRSARGSDKKATIYVIMPVGVNPAATDASEQLIAAYQKAHPQVKIEQVANLNSFSKLNELRAKRDETWNGYEEMSAVAIFADSNTISNAEESGYAHQDEMLDMCGDTLVMVTRTEYQQQFTSLESLNDAEWVLWLSDRLYPGDSGMYARQALERAGMLPENSKTYFYNDSGSESSEDSSSSSSSSDDPQTVGEEESVGGSW
ncbi:MAG: hypothetical protein ACOX69_05000 [Coriobacteriales bacterium]